jgi:2-oxoglutarate dehydrogenase E1 component
MATKTELTSGDFAELFGFSAGFVEKVYADYLAAPDSVGEQWRRFFDERLPAPKAAEPEAAPSRATAPPDDLEPIRGVAARIAANMTASLGVPTATSARDVPVRVLEENRRVINQHLAADFRGKASFTHIVAWALVQALVRHPALCVSYAERDGRPHRRTAAAINLGVAVDVPARDGTRSLVVPNLKDCAAMDFARFLDAYDDLIRKARAGRLETVDFKDTTCTLTNPGPMGTVSSLPRLMEGQSCIVATGAVRVPAGFEGASPGTLSELGISRVMTITNTYDHRVIQGADSGEFLATMTRLLTGEDGFYEGIFAALKIPHHPLSMQRDQRAAIGSPRREQEAQAVAARVMQYIRSYRVRGYLLADLDPLQYEAKIFPELEMSSYGLTVWDLEREFYTGGLTGEPTATLREIREILHDTYTRRIGAEFMHIADPEQKEWLRSRMESTRNAGELPREVMVRVLDRLVEAEAFERFLHTRFVGHKRFSVEGGETLIPVIDALLTRAAEVGVERAVLGMAHRGRLNVLAHVLGKPLTKIFSEFEGWIDPDAPQGSGDVKYHMGASGTFKTADGGAVALELASNPSHLEAVDPVVEGMVRARQDAAEGGAEAGRQRIVPILVHGDAAFAGQGVVAETLNMSQLHGYRTGGTVHVIVNNQIGYTTLPADARSTPYCSDVAKAIQAPIFHVNGDDPLAAVRVARLAFEYRQHFQRDVVIDIVCYRRHGHNEGDEPSYTQPLLYERIDSHPTVREIYQDYLLRAGVLQPQEVEAFNAALQQRLRSSLEEVRGTRAPDVVLREPAAEAWPFDAPTAVDAQRLRDLAQRLATLPEAFTPHPKIRMQLDRRVEMLAGAQPIDFGLAEHLAFASLVTDGVPVRLAGQDSGRGTFSQRHSVLLDCETGERYIPLNFLADDQARYSVIDSLLSEEAALGFEYGYSIASPRTLTLWEAQFGDFCNGAQIQIDQFLAAGEAKWGQASGLVLLLPHGYDGQGPEHSSARLERFLQLCAENNLRVAVPSTAASYFHLLRRQAADPTRKPLVVMTPKSLLRDRAAGAAPKDLSEGAFAAVIDDADADPPRVRRVVLCSGKVYYDLRAARDEARRDDVALVRVELLHPWPAGALAAVLERYGDDAQRIWCQEEPRNMGAWQHVCARLDGVRYAGRPASASPATGSLARHKAEQAAVVADALGGR